MLTSTPAATKTYPSLAERRAKGRALRQRVGRSAHARWEPDPDRPDPVALLELSNFGRVAELIPIRHGRMLPSAFTFFADRRRRWQLTWPRRRSRASASSFAAIVT